MDSSIRTLKPEDIQTVTSYFGHDLEWWLDRVRWYNAMNNTSISEAMVIEVFSTPPMADHSMRNETVHQLYTVLEFWQAHGGLEDLLCSS